MDKRSRHTGFVLSTYSGIILRISSGCHISILKDYSRDDVDKRTPRRFIVYPHILGLILIIR